MSNKGHRSGGKFGGSHTSFIPLAEVLVDIVAGYQNVIKISAGFIKAGLPSVSGQRRVKLADIQGGILLSIRDNTSHQEVRVYTSDISETKRTMSQMIRERRIRLSFGEQADE